MRRIFLVLAVIAMLSLSAMPAVADKRGNNNWWGNNDRGHNNNSWSHHNNNVFCNWYPSWRGWDYWCYSPWWGWYKRW
jgi:hypothetical protein